MLNDETSHTEGRITITTGPVRMAAIGSGAAMTVVGVAGLIGSEYADGGFGHRAVITVALVALVLAGLVLLVYGSIAAHTSITRHQARVREEIEIAASQRHQLLEERLVQIQQTVELQATIFNGFFAHLDELAQQREQDELGHRRAHRSG